MTKFVVPFLVVLFTSCGSEPEVKQTRTEKAPKKTKEEVAQTLEELTGSKVWLTDEKAPPFLTDYGKNNPENKLKVSTDFGDIVIQLYEQTPIHRANMIYLTKERQYFDATLFYRVAKDFVVQGGDSDSEYIQDRRFAIGRYELPPEFREGLYHKRGAVGMTRHYEGNPDKKSNPFDFYIVVGKKYSNQGLNAIEREHKTKFTEEQRELYKTKGGAPHLDGQHTVIGEVISGFDAVLKMNKVEVDKSEWPLEAIKMKVEVVN